MSIYGNYWIELLCVFQMSPDMRDLTIGRFKEQEVTTVEGAEAKSVLEDDATQNEAKIFLRDAPMGFMKNVEKVQRP